MDDGCPDETTFPTFMQIMFSPRIVKGEDLPILPFNSSERFQTFTSIMFKVIHKEMRMSNKLLLWIRYQNFSIWYLFFLTLLYIWCKILQKKREQTILTCSTPMSCEITSGTTRSASPFFFSRERASIEDSTSRLEQKHNNRTRMICRHRIDSIQYITWTPPTAWTDVSKRLILTKSKMKSRVTNVKLHLDVTMGKIVSQESDVPFDLLQLQCHVIDKLGGVLALYWEGVKMEHTFYSSQSAAQFQHDVISYRIAGKSIMNMYYSLELIQRGSEAHMGNEAVMHGSKGDSEVTRSAVAWYDVMKCLGCIFPSIRIALESAQSYRNENSILLASLASPYQNRRAMLSPVQFFRLFCPILPLNSQPVAQSSHSRMGDFVKLRKLVAQASLYVQAYVKGMIIVNKGWKLNWNKNLLRRLSYDQMTDNALHDTSTKNTYYDFHRFQSEHLSEKEKRHDTDPKIKFMQSYSLVGFHSFQLPACNEKNPNSFIDDPIEAIPSLRQIVTGNPELDFFCASIVVGTPGIVLVKLFVRTIPRTLESHTDSWIDFHAASGATERNESLRLILQITPSNQISTLKWAQMRALSAFLSSTQSNHAVMTRDSNKVRSVNFDIPIGKYLDVCHYGGSFNKNADSPQNYIAVNAHVDSNSIRNILLRSFLSEMENILPKSVTDFSYVLMMPQENKTEGMILGTIRLVNLTLKNVTLPMEVNANGMTDKACLRNTISLENKKSRLPIDNFQKEIDKLIETLLNVRVPIRSKALQINQLTLARYGKQDQCVPSSCRAEDFANLPILETLDRTDLRRYLVASGLDIPKATMRLIESAIWRGITFPIDTRACRIELQSGQFFQQGYDVDKFPVFYFRNMCLGPWRQDADAVMKAVLYRLDEALSRLPRDSKVTLIILLGRPTLSRRKRSRSNTVTHDRTDDETKNKAENTKVEPDLVNRDIEESEIVDENNASPFRTGINPRLQEGDEDFFIHTNRDLILQLLDTLINHYPERLQRALLVPGRSRRYGYWKSAFSLQLAIRNAIKSTKTRSKCIVLSHISELKKFVNPSDLVAFAGGEAPVHKSAFECP
jgi:hypothetical protein